MTAPVVQRIFAAAASGDSSRKIAMELNAGGIIPPLKYRVLYRDHFGDEGASHASDLWNYTTIKRILKNEVYLGHTLLGKTRKASIRSEKKLPVPQEDWAVTRGTHLPLVSQESFDAAALNLGKGTRNYQKYDHVRKSIFSGIAVCGRCGHSLCSCGTVYKGEREKYWYLSCTRQRPDIADPCEGVRIRYSDLLEVVRQDLNEILAMTDEQIDRLVGDVLRETQTSEAVQARQLQQERAAARLKTIDRVITKLYMDNAEGRLEDARLSDMVSQLQTEGAGLQRLLTALEPDKTENAAEDYQRFSPLHGAIHTLRSWTEKRCRCLLSALRSDRRNCRRVSGSPSAGSSRFARASASFTASSASWPQPPCEASRYHPIRNPAKIR